MRVETAKDEGWYVAEAKSSEAIKRKAEILRLRRNSLLLRRSIFVLSFRHHPRLHPFLLVSYRTRLFTKQSVPIPHSTCRCVFYECTHHSFLFLSLCRSFVERPFAICFASNSHPAVDLPCSLAASPFRAFLYSLLLVSCFISVVSFLVDNGIWPSPLLLRGFLYLFPAPDTLLSKPFLFTPFILRYHSGLLLLLWLFSLTS